MADIAASIASYLKQQLEGPDNRENVQVTVEIIGDSFELGAADPPRDGASAGELDLDDLLQNPEFLNIATEILADTNMRNLIATQMRQPDNRNLHLADEGLAARGERGPVDLAALEGLLQSPAVVNMEAEMSQDPNLQNLISQIEGRQAPDGAGAGQESMSSVLRTGRVLAEYMQANKPELVERQLRLTRPPAPNTPQ